MANAAIKGFISLQSGGDAANAYFGTSGGKASAAQVDITQCYVWDNTTYWSVEFNISVNAPNLIQRNFRALTAGGNTGVSAGSIILELGEIEYFLTPFAVTGNFNSSSNLIHIEMLCPKTEIKPAP